MAAVTTAVWQCTAYTHRAQRVVQEVEVGRAVERPRQPEPLPLPSREVDATLTDFGLIAFGEGLEVGGERTATDYLLPATPTTYIISMLHHCSATYRYLRIVCVLVEFV